MTKDKALLVLSLRYKSNDQLWFTFFHEAGHLLLHGKKMVFLEGMEGLDHTLEREADVFAQNLLIPPKAAEELNGLRTPEAIEAFSTRIGIHPGIVLGRLQREGLVPWNRLNHLKEPYAVSPDGRIARASD